MFDRMLPIEAIDLIDAVGRIRQPAVGTRAAGDEDTPAFLVCSALARATFLSSILFLILGPICHTQRRPTAAPMPNDVGSS